MRLTEAIQKYGLEDIMELLDMYYINKRVDNEKLRQWMINHKIIRNTTTIIRAYFQTGNVYRDENGSLYPRARRGLMLKAKNGRNQTKLNFVFLFDELDKLFGEELLVAESCQTG